MLVRAWPRDWFGAGCCRISILPVGREDHLDFQVWEPRSFHLACLDWTNSVLEGSF